MSEVEEIPVAIFLLEFEKKKSYVMVTRKKEILWEPQVFFAKISILSKIYGGNNHGLCLSELM